MKLVEKLTKFKNNLEISQKYQNFMFKRKFFIDELKKNLEEENRSAFFIHKRIILENFLLNKLKLKWLFAFGLYTEQYWKGLFFWMGNLLLNGSLIYLAITGIVKLFAYSPLLSFSQIAFTIFGLGLGIYIPTQIITQAYNKVSLERRLRERPAIYAQEIKNR